MEFTTSGLVSSLISILLVSLAIHFGAKPFVPKKNEKFLNALLVAVLGGALAYLVQSGLTGLLSATVAGIVALAAWALVAGIIYRASWFRGVLIGLAAWLIWFLVGLLLGLIF